MPLHLNDEVMRTLVGTPEFDLTHNLDMPIERVLQFIDVPSVDKVDGVPEFEHTSLQHILILHKPERYIERQMTLPRDRAGKALLLQLSIFSAKLAMIGYCLELLNPRNLAETKIESTPEEVKAKLTEQFNQLLDGAENLLTQLSYSAQKFLFTKIVSVARNCAQELILPNIIEQLADAIHGQSFDFVAAGDSSYLPNLISIVRKDVDIRVEVGDILRACTEGYARCSTYDECTRFIGHMVNELAKVKDHITPDDARFLQEAIQQQNAQAEAERRQQQRRSKQIFWGGGIGGIFFLGGSLFALNNFTYAKNQLAAYIEESSEFISSNLWLFKTGTVVCAFTLCAGFITYIDILRSGLNRNFISLQPPSWVTELSAQSSPSPTI